MSRKIVSLRARLQLANMCGKIKFRIKWIKCIMQRLYRGGIVSFLIGFRKPGIWDIFSHMATLVQVASVKMVLLSNEEFMSQLMLLAQKSKERSSFTVTFKRYDGNDRPHPREGRPKLPEPEEYMCIIRAKSKNKKLSTVVKRSDVPRVMENYARVMKICMDGLKRVKKVKTKAKAAQG